MVGAKTFCVCNSLVILILLTGHFCLPGGADYSKLDNLIEAGGLPDPTFNKTCSWAVHRLISLTSFLEAQHETRC